MLNFASKSITDTFMTKQKKIVNGREVELNVVQANNYISIIVLHKGTIIYSVIDGLNDNYTDAVNEVMHFLLNNLK